MTILLVVCIAAGFFVFVWWLWRDAPGPWTGRTLEPRERAAAQERVLFVCMHNSARSQMAEALLRRMAGARFHVASAGTTPTKVHPLAAQVMTERGLNLSSHRAKSVVEVGTRWDHVITLCDAAYEQCSEFPAKTSRLHWSIEDPARAAGPPAQQLEAFRRVRDDLAARLERWVADRSQRP